MCGYLSIRAPLPLLQACNDLPLEHLDPPTFRQCKVLLSDRYRILKLLGQGGFGRTFLVRDEQSDSASFCVIKQLFLESDERRSASYLFAQEVQRLAELGEHPQIPQLLASFEEDGFGFIVQEWVDGWTLQHELTDSVPFDEVEVWQVLRSLLPVLQCIHEHHVIHRDIKPANLIRRSPTAVSASLRKENKDLVLVDFGAAKHLSAISTVYTGTLIGSAEYAAPEQLRGQSVFASDLYSLGVTCVHLLTQMSPFDLYDSSENDWIWQTCLPTPISSKLERILCKLLQPGLRQRYQTAADVLQDMNESETSLAGAIDPRSPQLTPTRFLEPHSEEPCPVALTAAVQAVIATRSSAAVTVFEPQTQTWHHVTPIAELDTPNSRDCRRQNTPLKSSTCSTQTALSRQEQNPIELIFSVLLVIILTSVSSMTLICFCFEMERHAPILSVDRPLFPRMTVK